MQCQEHAINWHFFPLLQLFEEVEPLGLIVGHSTVRIIHPIWFNCPPCNRHDVWVYVTLVVVKKRSAPFLSHLIQFFWILVDGRAPSYQWDIQTSCAGAPWLWSHLFASLSTWFQHLRWATAGRYWELCKCCLGLLVGKHASWSWMRVPLVHQCESRTSLLVVPFLEADKHPDMPTYTDHKASHMLEMSKLH